MEGEGKIAETLCEVAEEVPWRKLLKRERGAFTQLSQTPLAMRGQCVMQRADATPTNEVRMEGFNETDGANLQRVKNAMAERAVKWRRSRSPDAAAAAAFAALLDAETRRAELAAKSRGRRKPRLHRLPVQLDGKRRQSCGRCRSTRACAPKLFRFRLFGSRQKT